jgi:hypothetical protein
LTQSWHGESTQRYKDAHEIKGNPDLYYGCHLALLLRLFLSSEIAEDTGEEAPPLVGAPVKEVWTFKALGEGKSNILKKLALSTTFKSF